MKLSIILHDHCQEDLWKIQNGQYKLLSGIKGTRKFDGTILKISFSTMDRDVNIMPVFFLFFF